MPDGRTNVAPPGQPMAEMGAAQRFFGVFFDPVKTFADIVRKPDFWAALIAMIVLSSAAAELLLSRISMQDIARRQLEASGRASAMSSAQLHQSVQIGAKVGTIILHVAGVAGVPLFVFIIALIGMAIMKLVFGNQPKFKAAWSVSTYAFLPSIFGGILLIIVALFGDPANVTSSNFAPTNVGFFLSPQSVSKPLYSIATSLNPFNLWIMALLGIGFAAASGGKVSSRSIFISFLVLWLAWVLIKAGMMAIAV